MNRIINDYIFWFSWRGGQVTSQRQIHLKKLTRAKYSLSMDKGMRTIFTNRLNIGFGPKFLEC